eukprot:1367351-Amorphochlora_amoeboformis.AAC.1
MLGLPRCPEVRLDALTPVPFIEELGGEDGTSVGRHPTDALLRLQLKVTDDFLIPSDCESIDHSLDFLDVRFEELPERILPL